MKVTITYEGGVEKTAEVKPSDMVAFEREYQKSWDEVQASPRIEHSFYLAWRALKRTGQEERTFDDFIDAVADLDAEGEEAPLERKP